MELQWFIDYLFLRKQIVQFNDVLFEPNPINTGVPQGSILGPLLFLIFFNDVHSPLRHCKIITYADDTVIFTSSSDFDVIQSNLSQDLDNLSNWFRDNELIFNLKKGKSEVMLFGTRKQFNLFQSCQFSYRSIILPSTPLHVINTLACIWTQHFILKRIFKKCIRRQQKMKNSEQSLLPLHLATPW